MPVPEELYKTETITVKGGLRGGLVLGRSHFEGGIKMWDINLKPLYPIIDNAFHRLFGNQSELQGGEYLINPYATKKFKKRIEEINSSTKDNKQTESLMKKSARYIIDCREHPYILVHATGYGQFIVNRQATIDNLEELERINDYGQDEIIDG